MKKKTFKLWVWGLWWMTSGLRYALLFLFFFYDVTSGIMSRFSGSKFVCILGYNTSL